MRFKELYLDLRQYSSLIYYYYYSGRMIICQMRWRYYIKEKEPLENIKASLNINKSYNIGEALINTLKENINREEPASRKEEKLAGSN